MSLLWTDLLTGGKKQWRKYIPEKSIDSVITLLKLNPDEIRGNNKETLKDVLWFELACISYVWGRPTLTRLGASQTQMKAYVKQTEKTLSNSLKILQAMHNAPTFDSWVQKPDILLGKAVREHLEETDDGLIDNDVPKIIQQLTTIIEAIHLFSNNLESDKRKQGVSKPSKDKHDGLLRQLCIVYKRYTGTEPISWNTGTSSMNDNQFTGKIIPFLEEILPHTHYFGNKTPEALQAKIARMRKSGKHTDIWEPAKSGTKK